MRISDWSSDVCSSVLIALAPGLGEAHAAKGLALYVLGRYSEALGLFDHAMRLDPALFEAHFFKARCCRLIGQREPALVLFENAIELRPHDYRCTGLLAEEYSALGFDREFRPAASRSQIGNASCRERG